VCVLLLQVTNEREEKQFFFTLKKNLLQPDPEHVPNMFRSLKLKFLLLARGLKAGVAAPGPWP